MEAVVPPITQRDRDFYALFRDKQTFAHIRESFYQSSSQRTCENYCFNEKIMLCHAIHYGYEDEIQTMLPCFNKVKIMSLQGSIVL